MLFDTLDNPMDTADGNHPIALFKGAEHTLGFLLFFVLGADDEEIENTDDCNEGNKLEKSSAAGWGFRALSSPKEQVRYK
jgi:hypothetical protein